MSTVLARFSALNLELAQLRAVLCECGHPFAAHSLAASLHYTDPRIQAPCRGDARKSKCRCKGFEEREMSARLPGVGE
jgi:hypothetical protein